MEFLLKININFFLLKFNKNIFVSFVRFVIDE